MTAPAGGDPGARPPGWQALPVRWVLGVPVRATTEDRMVELCDEVIRAGSRLAIGVVNAAKMVRMRSDPLLRESVLGSDVVLADGMSVVWASRLLGQPLPARVNGTNLFEKLLALAEARGYPVYFLGATQDVLDAMLERITARHPRLRIAGAQHGYFRDEDGEGVAEAVAAAKPDMLFLGMTSPKKEVFMARHGPRMQVPICHGVGGSFDVLAGVVPRAPVSWQNAGLEWLFRLLQEPRRMWKRYLVTNSLFTFWVGREWLGRLLRRPVSADRR